MIEDASVDLDSIDSDHGPITVAYLRLEGDFVDEFEKYLNDEKATGVSLRIDRNTAEKLHHDLTEIIYG